jgi:SAM-dependent methyltransferase
VEFIPVWLWILVVEVEFGHVIFKIMYEVFGVDQSKAMIRLARKSAPNAKFKTGSLFDTKLPSCVAVTSLGECISYFFDSGNSMLKLFHNVYSAYNRVEFLFLTLWNLCLTN